MHIKNLLRDFIAWLSLSNLIMLKVWLAIIPFYAGLSFWAQHSPANTYLAAMITTVLIASILWFIAIVIDNRWQRGTTGLRIISYSIALCFVLNGIRVNNKWAMASLYRVCGNWSWLLVGSVILLFVCIVLLIFHYRSLVVKYHRRVLLLLAPFLFVTFGQSLLALQQVEPESAFVGRPLRDIPLVGDGCAMPIVWIIFDELDYRIAFGNRPRTLSLPELDKLRLTSLFATQAYSPAGDTGQSIPALLTGKAMILMTPQSEVIATLTARNGTNSMLTTQSTIFADMQKRGKRTSLFGWVFPYARLFRTVDVIKNYSTLIIPTSESIAKMVVFFLRSLVESGYFSPFGDSIYISHHILITRTMQKDVISFFQKNQGGFTFLHYPVPHSLNIYNRYTKIYGANRNIKEGYLDNVALADRLLGEVRTTMQKTGAWDKTLVIVSADHHWRTNTYDGIIDRQHVPFLVKLPSQKSSISVAERFETVNTRKMIIDIVDRKINTPEELKKWMELQNEEVGR